jgi:glycosyltransferase involved in cell wall biosynthesis
MNDVPTVSVVIPTWNHARLLPGAVSSILTQRYPAEKVEIVVSDDGSTDDTSDVMALIAQRHPEVVYLWNAHRGGNAARNAGIEAAKGEIICFLDADELAPPGWLEALIDSLAVDSTLSAVGGPCVSYGKERVRRCRRCGPAGAGTVGGLSYLGLMGGNMAVRQHVFTGVGMFDPAITGNGSEMEWFFRCREAGLRFREEPSAWVYHRRDIQGLVSECRKSFRAAQSIPRVNERAGHPIYDPTIPYMLRCLGHGIVHCCGGGFTGAAHALGLRVAIARYQSAQRPR